MASFGRIVVEMQKTVTRTHRAILQSPLGRRLGAPFLVLATTGRRSGARRETVLSFTRDGDCYVVIASDGGARRHPDWYLNLTADPDVTVEVAGRRLEATAETVTGEDRDRLWRQAVATYVGYAAYQARTEREIPVVRLRPKQVR